LAKLVPSERFAENAWATLVCFFYALILSYGIGLAIGVWMGVHRLSGAVGEPILISLYTLPKVTLYPVVLLIFWLSLSGRVTFGGMHGVLPVALLTMNAIRNIPPVYLKSAQTLQLSRWQTILTVLFPATLPEVIAGLRIGFSLTLLGVLLAEMFAAKHGLGFLIINAMQLMQAEEMVTIAVVLFAFAALANALLLWVKHQLHRRVKIPQDRTEYQPIPPPVSSRLPSWSFDDDIDHRLDFALAVVEMMRHVGEARAAIAGFKHHRIGPEHRPDAARGEMHVLDRSAGMGGKGAGYFGLYSVRSAAMVDSKIPRPMTLRTMADAGKGSCAANRRP